jgi:hypothetical protein
MSDPKHPHKVVIVIRGGLVDAIFVDKSGLHAKFYIADYDHPPMNSPLTWKDHKGQDRYIYEDTAMLDTASVRNILNKKGAKKDGQTV